MIIGERIRKRTQIEFQSETLFSKKNSLKLFWSFELGSLALIAVTSPLDVGSTIWRPFPFSGGKQVGGGGLRYRERGLGYGVQGMGYSGMEYVVWATEYGVQGM